MEQCGQPIESLLEAFGVEGGTVQRIYPSITWRCILQSQTIFFIKSYIFPLWTSLAWFVTEPVHVVDKLETYRQINLTCPEEAGIPGRLENVYMWIETLILPHPLSTDRANNPRSHVLTCLRVPHLPPSHHSSKLIPIMSTTSPHQPSHLQDTDPIPQTPPAPLPFDYYGDDPHPSTLSQPTDLPYISTSTSILLPPPNFQPFFTLIEDAATHEHHHPAVHYIFSDDEGDAVTRASLLALTSSGSASSASPLDDDREEEDEGAASRNLTNANDEEDATTDSSASARDRPARLRRNGAKERYILIDIAPDGRSVRAAHSLSPEWAVTATSITRAATLDGNTGDTTEEEGRGGGMMLRIEGTEGGGSVVEGRGGDGGGVDGKGPEEMLEEARRRGGGLVKGMEELRREIERGMEVLERVVGGIEEGGEEG